MRLPYEKIEDGGVYYRIMISKEGDSFYSTCRQYFDEIDYDQRRSLKHRFKDEDQADLWAEILTNLRHTNTIRKIEHYLGGYGD